MTPISDAERLTASLALSCALHAALFFTPYLGASTSASRAAVLGGQNMAPPRTLEATLVLARQSAFAAAELSPLPAPGGSAAAAAAERAAGEETRPALERTSGIGLLPIAAPTYYSSDELTKRAQPASEPELDGPELLPILASGKIVLKLWIDEGGDVLAVDIEKSDLPGVFSNAAVTAFRKLRFLPGEINGRRVRTVMRIEVTYDDGGKTQP